MWLKNFIHSLKRNPTDQTKKSIKTIRDLKIFDTIWVEEDCNIFEGWIFDITRRCIIVVYGPELMDFRFRIEKSFNNTELKQDNKVLYCNIPESL